MSTGLVISFKCFELCIKSYTYASTKNELSTTNIFKCFGFDLTRYGASLLLSFIWNPTHSENVHIRGNIFAALVWKVVRSKEMERYWICLDFLWYLLSFWFVELLGDAQVVVRPLDFRFRREIFGSWLLIFSSIFTRNSVSKYWFK